MNVIFFVSLTVKMKVHLKLSMQIQFSSRASGAKYFKNSLRSSRFIFFLLLILYKTKAQMNHYVLPNQELSIS